MNLRFLFARDIKWTNFFTLYTSYATKSYLLKKTAAFRKLNQRNLASVHSIGMELKEVVAKLESFASTKLAENWDNVGLLIQPSSPLLVNVLFLTNDLTEDVLDESVSKGANMILCYHPPIFRSLKRITQSSWKERLVVKAFENRIAIYSPHTAYDVIKGGVNDWLISCFEGIVSPINPLENDSTCGSGRICQLKSPLLIAEVISKIKEHLGLNFIRVGYSRNGELKMINSIATCAGSGATILEGVRADVYLTGEMSHHEILDAVSNDVTVLLCEHSNTERGFLKNHSKTLTSLLDYKVQVICSEVDKDPILLV
ncbi:NIF3-like protein 1 isoform X2 [Hydra vulgaris]|uniref:NIF3-like protein 1 n=1 Tax=Hydra vulgaris TaxID=6087 RepID=A0ABM4CNX8_HYDVU